MLFVRVTFVIATLATAAAAAQPAPAAPASEAPAVQFQRVTEHEFEPEAVDGRTLRPDAEAETARVRRPLPSLVRVRADFDHALLQSAEDL